LIVNASVLFDDKVTPATSPPLPPAPAGQLPPNYTYGSAHTKIASLPAPPQMPDDFTPLFPPRPTNSIHPSSRTNPTSPTNINMDPPPLPAKPGQAGPSKSAAAERPAAPPVSVPEKVSPPLSTSAPSTSVTDEQASAVLERHHDSGSLREPTSSVFQVPKSLESRMLSSPALAAGESMQALGGEPRTSATSPSLPGTYLS